MNALILAGSRGPDDSMAKAAGVSHKAMIPVVGVPMLLRVIQALAATAGINRIYVCIENPEIVRALVIEHDLRNVETISASSSPAASVVTALVKFDLSLPLLITTADHPLLTPAILQRFVESAPRDCDLAFALAPSDVVSAAYPGAIRTFYKLGGKRYSGCNLFLARTTNAIRVAEFWRRAEAFRKRPARLIWEIGPLALLRIMLGLMDADAACAYLSRKAGAITRHVELPIAEAAIDVDKPADLELVEKIFASRAR